MKDKFIKLEHGLGGEKSRQLIKEIILPAIRNEYAEKMDDAAVLPFTGKELIFTADSFVVDPPFFQGGNMGKLSVAGTVNDIIAQGGKPLYISMTVTVDEGFAVSDLEKIAKAAGKEAADAGVKIVCGDLKVVESGAGITVSSSGIGEKISGAQRKEIEEGDAVLVTGPVGKHGAAIFQARNKILSSDKNVISDCASLSSLVEVIEKNSSNIKFMRDPTRGGLAEVLLELSEKKKRTISINENAIPVEEWVRGLCYITGFDPLYLACEGQMVIVTSEQENVASSLKSAGFNAASVIGIVGKAGNKVLLETSSGGTRILTNSDIVQIPRIC